MDTDECTSWCVSHLCDPWMGALAVDAVVLQPLVLGVGAVLLEGAAVLSFTPYTPKQRVCLQTQTTASTLGVAFVQMDCAGGRKEPRERGKENQWEGKGRENGNRKREKELRIQVNSICTNDYRTANACKFILGKSL